MVESLKVKYRSARYADDAGHRKFTEEVYEHQYRLIAGAQWQPKAIAWTDLVKMELNCLLLQIHSVVVGWR